VLEEKFVVTEVILPLLVTLEHLHTRKILHRWVGGTRPYHD
jgi:hypothetical protein